MFLSRIMLENVRSIPAAELSFALSPGQNRKWTLIMGENGCGKSSLLRAIALATAGSRALPALLPTPAALVRNGAELARIEVTMATSTGEERTVKLEIRPDDSIADVLKRNDEGMRALDTAIARASRNYFVAAYGASRRLPSQGTGSNGAATKMSIRAKSVLSLFDRDATLEPLDSWIMQQDYVTDGAGLDAVRDALSGLLPRVEFARIDKRRQEVLFKTDDGEVPLSELSDGYQNVAAWCGDLLAHITRAFDDRERPQNARGLLLLDEIDLHLHPRWQRALLEYIDRQFPQLQVVATTHSPFTAQQARPGELFLMPRNDTGTVELRAFAGDARRMRIEQLVDPLLGIDTTESRWFELRRAALEEARKTDDTARTRELEAELGAVVQERLTDRERSELALLERIESALGVGTERLP